MSVCYLALISACIDAAEQSSTLIVQKMSEGKNNSVENKTDGEFDPQTEADIGAQYIIESGLQALFPQITIIGEEPSHSLESYCTEFGITKPSTLSTILLSNHSEIQARYAVLPPSLQNLTFEDTLIYIDPLDGTSEFTKGKTDHVTTLISITYKGHALGGVIFYPFTGDYLFGGIGLGCFAATSHKIADALGNSERRPFTILPPRYNQYTIIAKHPFYRQLLQDWLIENKDKIENLVDDSTTPHTPFASRKVVTTKSHFKPEIQEYFTTIGVQPEQLLRAGGAGHKGVFVLTGQASAYTYPISGTKRWDTGALDGLLFAHGGLLTNVYGDLYDYTRNTNKESIANTQGCICTLYNHNDFILPRPVQNQ